MINKKKNLLMVASFVVVFGVIASVGVVRAFTSTEAPKTVIENVEVYNEATETTQEEVVGGTATPYYPYNFEVKNGITSYFYSSGMATATTSVCSFLSPAATSTLEFLTVDFDVSSTTASVITIATGANTTATTTVIGNEYNIAANAKATIIASSTDSDFVSGLNGMIIAPSQYINVGMKGGAGTFSPTGNCITRFTVVSQ